tara:strand:- start:720 stop:1160 length:441 start_codon:yes stop_codon:yes gene_type:complete
MSFFGDLMAGKAAQNAANYNAALGDRNAKIKEQEAKAGYAVYTKFDLPRFNDNAEKLTGAINTNYASSGVERSGTVFDVLFENELRLETDRDMLKYNAEVVKQQKENDAINLRAEADIERYRGKVRRKVSYFQAGQSLLNFGSQFQ